MHVFRLEHPSSGRGPYGWALGHDISQCACASCAPSWEMAQAHTGDVRFAPPVPPEGWQGAVWACRTLEALAWWFEGYLERLLAAGYVIREFDVKEAVYEDAHQIAFLRAGGGVCGEEELAQRTLKKH